MIAQRPHVVVGDVLLCNVMYSDYSGIKKRPVLVISTFEYHSGGDDIIVAKISSQISSPVRHSVLLDCRDSGFLATGLKRSSLVDCTKISTIHYSLFTHRLGTLPGTYLDQVRKHLKTIFAIR